MAERAGGAEELTRVFVSYAREDRRWLDPEYRYNVVPFLRDSLKRYRVAFWFDKELVAGDEFRRKIEAQIDQAQIALLIVTQAFLNSEFIEHEEMPRIVERASAGKMIVVPVLVEPCDWQEYPVLADRQMVPGAIPLIDFTESEARWARVKVEILEGLKTQVKRIRATRAEELAAAAIAAQRETAAEQAQDAARRKAAGDEARKVRDAEARAQRDSAENYFVQPQSADVQGAESPKVWWKSRFTVAYALVPVCIVLAVVLFLRRPTASGTPAPASASGIPASASTTINPVVATQVPLLRTLQDHTSFVYSVAFSPDGRTLASGSWDTIKLWDVASGALLRTLHGHTHPVESVAFSPDGRTLASGSEDKTIKLWDVASGALLRTLHGHTDTVKSVAFSPDGRTLASGSDDKTIKLWDFASGAELRTLQGHTHPVESVAFSPDGRTLASGSRDNTVKLWDVASGALLRTLQGHTSYVLSVAFSPEGRTLASGSYDDTIELWDVASGALLRTLQGHTGTVESVVFSPDGRTLASGSHDKTIKLWDVSGVNK